MTKKLCKRCIFCAFDGLSTWFCVYVWLNCSTIYGQRIWCKRDTKHRFAKFASLTQNAMKRIFCVSAFDTWRGAFCLVFLFAALHFGCRIGQSFFWVLFFFTAGFFIFVWNAWAALVRFRNVEFFILFSLHFAHKVKQNTHSGVRIHYVLLRNMHNRSGGPTTRSQFLQYCLSRNFFVSATKKEKRIRYRKTLFYRYLRCNLDILAQHAILLGWYIICTHKNDFGMQTKKRQRNFLLSNKRNIKCTLIQHLFLLYFASLWQYFLYTLRICHINRTKMPVERLLKRLNPFSLGLT